MPIRVRPGKASVHVYVDEKITEWWRKSLAANPALGGSLTDAIVAAMARHIEYPPPTPTIAPLPSPAPQKPRGRPKKNLEENV